MNSDGSYHGGFEYSVALGLLGLLFLVFGGGVVSLDRVFARKKPAETADEPQPADEAPTATTPAVPSENTFFSARP